MTDLSQALSELKSLPDQELQRELAQPTGAIPDFLILSELHERRSTRLGAEAAGPVQQPKSMASEYIGDIRNYLPAPSAPPPQYAPPNSPPSGMPFPATGKPAGAGLPMGAGSGIQSLPPRPTGYARGGLATLVKGYLEGGIVTDPNYQYLQDEDAYNWMASFPDSNPYPDAKPLTRAEVFQPMTSGEPPSDAEIEQIMRQAGGVPGYAGGGVVAYNEPWRRAFLDAIAQHESGGRYDVITGGRSFDPSRGHPNIVGVVTEAGPSTAAGRYQITHSTYNELGGGPFDPASQDRMAWNLASQRYNRLTGGDLASTLQTGDPAALQRVGQVLSPTWTSLANRNFAAQYQQALGNPLSAAAAGVAQAQGAVATQAATTAAQVAGSEQTAASGGADPMMQLLMLSQMMGGGQQAHAAPMAMPMQPYEPPPSTERHAELERRNRYG